MTYFWNNRKPSEIFDELGSGERGLPAAEAEHRVTEEGQNTLPAAKPDTVVAIFVRQFRSPLIYILFAAGGAIFLMGEIADAVIILAVLFFNAIVGTVQEGRAQNTLRALQKFSETSATVLRDGQELVIPDRDVARGDIILLQEGEKAPADARLLDTHNLMVDEAALTGESLPVGKDAVTMENEARSASECRNMLFKGTNIVAGSGTAIVVATGQHTLIGTIAREISSIHSEIPLEANIRKLSNLVLYIVAVVCAFIFVLGLLRGEPLGIVFATAVSLAVSVIPEGLPIVMTLVLATGVWRMSRRNALVKKLQAVEALGQARVIAVDKTGTLTKNELLVREVWTAGSHYTVDGVGYDPHGGITTERGESAQKSEELRFASEIAALCGSARLTYAPEEKRWRVAGDPTEAALRVFAEKAGFARDNVLRDSPLAAEMPFDYRLKYHAVLAETKRGRMLAVAGAPETVLALCTQVYRDGASHAIRQHDIEEVESTIARMSRHGLRVIAVAARGHALAQIDATSVHGLSMVALFGIQDALRPEAADAVRRASAAGIRVVMITGDHKLTARAIAHEAGIWKEGDHIYTGAELDEMSDVALAARLDGVSVFARVTPEHKLRIVNAFKQRGEIVAMTGDGVNDAPSLVAADLGVAMGRVGTEVAKEAADIVLLDDDFGSIVSAVEEGRSIYMTIKKVVLYLFSTGLGEVLTIASAIALGYPLPLLASQIIWLNFVTDGFLDVALAMEPRERGLLTRSFGKPDAHIIDGAMAWRMIVMALPMAAGTLFMFDQYLGSGLEKAWTISLTTLAIFQWFNAWNCRSENASILTSSPLANPYLFGATLFVILLQVAAVYTPALQHVLHTVPLSFAEWVFITAIALSVILVEEARKYIHRTAEARRSAFAR